MRRMRNSSRSNLVGGDGGQRLRGGAARHWGWFSLLGVGAMLVAVALVLALSGTSRRVVPFQPVLNSGAEQSTGALGRVALLGDARHSDSGEFVSSAQPMVPRLELCQIEPALNHGPWDGLRISGPGEERLVDLRPGAVVEVEGGSYRIASVRTWQGVLPIERGVPAASVSLFRDGDTIVEDLVIEKGDSAEIAGGPSVELHWHSDAAAARKAAQDGAGDEHGETLGKARWGVADGPRMQWFESFAPGTGVTLNDGTLIQLEAYQPAPGKGRDSTGAVLVVQSVRDGNVKRFRIVGASNEPPIFVQYPEMGGDRFRLDGFASGHVLVEFTGGDERSDPAELEAGETWRAPSSDLAIRLEAAEASGAPIVAGDSPYFEAVLDGSDRRVRVRQGEAVRVGDTLLRYVRRADYASAAFRLCLYRSRGEAPETFVLYPGSRCSLRLEGETWTLAHRDVRPGEELILRRRLVDFRWIGAVGVVLVVAGLFGLVARRRAGR